MKIHQYIPADSLKPFIRSFLVIENEQARVNNILPDTAIVLAFRFRGAVSDTGRIFPSSIISGIRAGNRQVTYSGNSANLLVIFREAGAAAFFKQPMHELFGMSVSLDEFFPAGLVSQMEEKLSRAANHAQRIALLEQFLLSAQKSFQPDPLINTAIQQIKNTQGAIRIRELAGSLHISQDAFEKKFRRITGSTPKQFARIIRLRHVIELYPQTKNLTDAAYAAGYFDQAHFIKDFRLFTGQAPNDFFASATFW